MPLLALARILFGAVSLGLLALSIYWLYTWGRGDLVTAADGVVYTYRESWRLWAGLGLLAFSFLGRWIVPLVLAGPDRAPSLPTRSGGRLIDGAEGSTLYVERHGPADGPLVIFTHGWGLDSTIWNCARRDLAMQMRLLTWDLPGMGRSRLGADLSLEHLSDNLKAVIEQAGRRRVVLVGHSIGGMTIQTLARDHPELVQDRVAGVVLLNTTYINPLRTMILSPLLQALRLPVLQPLMYLMIGLQPLVWLMAWQSYLSGSAHMAQRLGFGPDVTRSQLEHVTLLITRNPPGVQAKGNLAMFDWDATDALTGLGVPTLVLAGDRDIVTKAEAGQRIAAGIAQSEIRVVPRANHMGPLEQAAVYHEAIAEFVRATSTEDSEVGAQPTTLAASPY